MGSLMSRLMSGLMSRLMGGLISRLMGDLMSRLMDRLMCRLVCSLKCRLVCSLMRCLLRRLVCDLKCRLLIDRFTFVVLHRCRWLYHIAHKRILLDGPILVCGIYRLLGSLRLRRNLLFRRIRIEHRRMTGLTIRRIGLSRIRRRWIRRVRRIRLRLLCCLLCLRWRLVGLIASMWRIRLRIW